MSFPPAPTQWNPRPAQDPFRDPVDPFADTLEEVEMTSFSSQSNAKHNDPRMHIMENIKNRKYDCFICSNKVTGGLQPTNYMWECNSCHIVTHFRCMQSRSSKQGPESNEKLPCPNPNCTKSHYQPYKATCWCGKQDAPICNLDSPNACRKDCKKRGVCSHEHPTICRRTCHPGLCDFVCSDSCSRTATGPSTLWSRFLRRWHTRARGTATYLYLLLALIIAIDGLWVMGSIMRARRLTMPYKYLGWNEGSAPAVTGGLGLVLSILSTMALLLITGCCSAFVFKTAAFLFNLNHSKKSSLTCAKFFIFIFLALLAIAAGLVPAVLYNSLPDILWYNKMRDSCNGYETRITMDRDFYISPRSTRARQASQYEVHNLSPTSQPEQDQVFALASRYDPAEDSNQPYQKYFRFSSAFDLNNGPWAIDVDLGKHVWRVLKLDRTDVANNWISQQFTSTIFASPPTLQPINQTIIRNGTFTAIDKKSPHMAIPSLGYVIADMHSFVDSCYREPFLRVFRGNTTSIESTMAMADQEWSNKPNENIVMRTASFGHRRQRLDMCARNEVYSDSTSQHPDTMDKDLMIAFAIISAARMRVADTEARSLSCGSR